MKVFRTTGRSLTSLDLSHNLIGSAGAHALAIYLREVGLTHLNLSKNQLCDVWTSRGVTAGVFNTDGMCALLLAIDSAASQDNECLKLEQLDVSRNMLGQETALMDTLCDVIDSNIDYFSVFNLTGNYFDEADMTRLIESVTRNNKIVSYCRPSVFVGSKKMLNLASSNLAPFDFLFLNSTFEHVETLPRCVDFSWNREFGIGDTSFPRNTLPFQNVHTLRLTNISMDIDYAANLRVVLERPECRLSSLDVAGNASTLDREGFNHLLMGLKGNTSLLYLSLVACVPRSYRTYDLIREAIEANKTLLELDLSQSHGCQFDAGPLFIALKTNKTLQTLRMSRCEINAAGISFLSEMIDVNKTLTCLDLSHNYICKLGWDKEFNSFPALSVTVALRHLNTDADPSLHSLGAEWSPVSCLPSSLFPLPSLLRELNFSHNKLEESVMEGLSEALKNQLLNVATLNLGFCDIGERGGQVLGKALPQVTCVKKLLLGRNNLGVAGIEVSVYVDRWAGIYVGTER